MDLYINYVLFVIGLVMIVKGSDWFVDAAVWGAKISGIPEMVIGATIVSMCTTLPETMVAITASIEGETNMVVGNSLGSIAANTGLILAVMFVFSKPKTFTSRNYQSNGIFLVLLLSITWLVGMYVGSIDRMMGLVLITMFVIFLYRNFLGAKQSTEGVGLQKSNHIEQQRNPEKSELGKSEQEKSEPNQSILAKSEILKNVFLFLFGIILVIWGAKLVVDKGIWIAESLGIPTIVVAIIFTSFGTSLPELITAISAIKKGAIQLGMGNIIGADILNLLQVIGFSALITPIDLTLDKSILYFQFPMNILLCIVAVFFNWKGKKKLQRISGILLLVLYLVFLLVNILREATPIIGQWIFW